jgi:hypothetical protein
MQDPSGHCLLLPQHEHVGTVGKTFPIAPTMAGASRNVPVHLSLTGWGTP